MDKGRPEAGRPAVRLFLTPGGGDEVRRDGDCELGEEAEAGELL